MTCCQCQGIERFFGKRMAARELKKFRKKGATGTTRQLIDALEAQGIDGMTLLDIGGGIGAIQHELLDLGVSRATNVEASTAYLDAAKVEAERLGRIERVQYRFGNFTDLAPDTEPEDIVTLDRVICCYPDMEKLVGLSMDRARKYYGLVYPRDVWVVEGLRYLINFAFWCMRNPFRFFVHSTQAVDDLLRKNGLTQIFHSESFIFQVALYARR